MLEPASPKNYNNIDRPGPVKEMLAQVGRRVEMIRAQRAMTRKRLAEVSGVSLAYLARLEAGKGNISLQLLKQVADALGVGMVTLVSVEPGVSVDELLLFEYLRTLPAERVAEIRRELMQSDTPAALVRSNRIALIGLRGVGKTTVGHLLAEELGRPFVELDKEIESEMGLEIREIFEHMGLAEFRRAEQQCLNLLIESNKPMVIAAAGGIVSEITTYSALLSSCLSIYLKASPQCHMERVQAQNDNRLMGPEVREEAMDTVWQTLKAREELYQRADIVLDTSELSVEEVVHILKKKIADQVSQIGETLG